MQIVIFQNPEVFEGIYKITPTGNILLMTKEKIENSIQWLYNTSLLPLDPTRDIFNNFFPLRSLLLLGNIKTECFFCGSHFHDAESCPNKWISENKISIDYLSKTSPKAWFDDIKTLFQAGDTYGSRLENLIADMRREFSWNFANNICKTTSTTFQDMFLEIDIEKNETPFDSVLLAMKRGDHELIKKNLGNIADKIDDPMYFVLKGLFEVSSHYIDKALISFITAENTAQNAVVKSYAKLLRFRLYYTNNQYDECQSLLETLEKEWVAPNEFTYQRALLAASTNNPVMLVESLRKFLKHPRWLTLSLCEPVFLPFESKIEKFYSSFLSEYVKKNNVLFEESKKFVKNMEEIFGIEKFSDFHTKLSNIETEINTGSLISTIQALSDLHEFKKKIDKKKKELVRILMEKLSKMFKEIKFWSVKMPNNSRTKDFKKSCAMLMNDIREISEMLDKFHSDDEKNFELEDKFKKIQEIDKEYKELKVEFPKRIKQESQKEFIKNYVVRSLIFMFLLLGAFFLFFLILKFF